MMQQQQQQAYKSPSIWNVYNATTTITMAIASPLIWNADDARAIIIVFALPSIWNVYFATKITKASQSIRNVEDATTTTTT